MQRPGQPYELAPAYVYLASGDSSYVTGQSDTCKWGRYCKWIVFIYKSKVMLIPLIIVSAEGDIAEKVMFRHTITFHPTG
ncbi:hypothetical protein AAHB49_09030 [Bacillus cereus]